MNEFIQPDITEPRYNKLDYSSWFSSRLLGTKRFELTDHLGNVSSVILDRKTPVNTGSVLHKYDPDVQLVLDYYPYGMVMKEGYCDTCDPNAVTQTTGPALKMVNTDYTLLPQNYPPLTGSTVANWAVVTGGEAEPQEEGQLSWEGTGGGMLFTCLNEVNPGNHELGLTVLMEVTAEEAHEIEIVVDIDDAGELEAKIISYTDPEHTEYDVLTSTEIPTSTGYLLQFTPTTDTVWLWIGRKAEHGFASGTKFKVTGTTTAKTTWTVYQMNIQGLLHSWRSPYRFAYNGQERVDDIKGKTNHNTALHWEYDTRRAWRWNRDPVVNYSLSPYAVFGNNPIQFNDPLGDEKGDVVLKDDNKGAKGTIAPNGGTRGGDGSITGGEAFCKGCGARGEDTWGVPDENTFGGTGPMNLLQAGAQDIGRNDENRKQVDMVNQSVGLFMGITASPLAAISGGAAGAGSLFTVSTELAGTKAVLSWGFQALLNGIREVDYMDVAGDAFTAPGLNALLSGGIDFKPFASENPNQLRVQGLYNSKGAGQFGIDAAIGFGFGTVGDVTWKPIGSLLKSPTEKTIFYLSTQSAISVGQQGMSKVISNHQGE